jgi:hypothetical protein
MICYLLSSINSAAKPNRIMSSAIPPLLATLLCMYDQMSRLNQIKEQMDEDEDNDNKMVDEFGGGGTLFTTMRDQRLLCPVTTI